MLIDISALVTTAIGNGPFPNAGRWRETGMIDEAGCFICRLSPILARSTSGGSMNRLIQIALVVTFTVGLAACAQRPSQNVYNYDEVGKSTAVSFGTVISNRQVDITGKNTGAGALIGAGVGAGAGSYAGSGSGSIWTAAAGALVGAAVGAAAEQAAADRVGIEYIVILESGVTMTIVQDIGKSDVAIPDGSRVIVQNSGGYQRVLPASNLPTEMARPQGIRLVDPPSDSANN